MGWRKIIGEGVRYCFYLSVIFLAVHTTMNYEESSPEVNTQMVNVTTEKPIYNLSCPEVNVPKPNVTVKDFPDNIQNADYSTDTGYESDTYSVHGVDATGELYGSSMAPSIMDGDVVLSEEYSGQELSEGMIIRFESESNGPIIHRIVGNYVEQGFVYTSGDRIDSREKVDLNQISHVVKGVVYG